MMLLLFFRSLSLDGGRWPDIRDDEPLAVVAQGDEGIEAGLILSLLLQ